MSPCTSEIILPLVSQKGQHKSIKILKDYFQDSSYLYVEHLIQEVLETWMLRVVEDLVWFAVF